MKRSLSIYDLQGVDFVLGTCLGFIVDFQRAVFRNRFRFILMIVWFLLRIDFLVHVSFMVVNGVLRSDTPGNSNS